MTSSLFFPERYSRSLRVFYSKFLVRFSSFPCYCRRHKARLPSFPSSSPPLFLYYIAFPPFFFQEVETARSPPFPGQVCFFPPPPPHIRKLLLLIDRVYPLPSNPDTPFFFFSPPDCRCENRLPPPFSERETAGRPFPPTSLKRRVVRLRRRQLAGRFSFPPFSPFADVTFFTSQSIGEGFYCSE